MKEKITYIKVDDLKLNPNNPRKNDHAVDKVMLSIQKYGFKNPLIVGKDMVVYCGNTRLKGAKKIGLEEVPCIVVEDLDEKQIREYAILDNKLNEIADWDYDLLEAELTDLDLDEFELDGSFMVDIENNDGNLETKAIEKKLCQCPMCGHINEEKAFKYNENSD